MAINLEKIKNKSPELHSVAEKTKLSLDKRGLSGTTAKVALVVDHSGSMRSLFSSGSIQKLSERVLALASQLDDDGAIDFFLFDHHADYMGEVTLDNYKGSVDRLKGSRRMGTTNYTDAFNKVMEHYDYPINGQVTNTAQNKSGGFLGKLLGKNVESSNPAMGAHNKGLPASEPVFVFFLTDGSPDNRTSATNALTEAASYPVFWKFFSIGQPIPYLQKLDDLKGRFIDNADYKPVPNIDSISDGELVEMVLDEYEVWVKEAKQKGLLK